MTNIKTNGGFDLVRTKLTSLAELALVQYRLYCVLGWFFKKYFTCKHDCLGGSAVAVTAWRIQNMM